MDIKIYNPDSLTKDRPGKPQENNFKVTVFAFFPDVSVEGDDRGDHPSDLAPGVRAAQNMKELESSRYLSKSRKVRFLNPSLEREMG